MLPAAGTKAALAEADVTELKTTADGLMDAFGKVDATMHGDGEVKYSDVSEQVDKAVATLKRLAKVE